MPPKGWRKNAEGSHPVSSKERDSISIDDILFPKATVNRLARAILEDGGLVSKDSSIALQRSSTVFVSYLLTHARQNAKKFDRKTIGPQDIISALEQAEFSSFIPSVREELDSFQARKNAQRARKREEKEAAAAAAAEAIAAEGEIQTATNITPTGEISVVSTTQDIKEGGNDTVDENDSLETVDNDETLAEEESVDQPQSEGPKTKKMKASSREGTVSDDE